MPQKTCPGKKILQGRTRNNEQQNHTKPFRLPGLHTITSHALQDLNSHLTALATSKLEN
jgi:hypothetical protein